MSERREGGRWFKRSLSSSFCSPLPLHSLSLATRRRANQINFTDGAGLEPEQAGNKDSLEAPNLTPKAALCSFLQLTLLSINPTPSNIAF